MKHFTGEMKHFLRYKCIYIIFVITSIKFSNISSRITSSYSVTYSLSTRESNDGVKEKVYTEVVRRRA